MTVGLYDLYVNDRRLPYLQTVGEAELAGTGNCASPEAVAGLMNAAFSAGSLAEERLWMLALDPRNQLKGICEVAKGSPDSACFTRAQIAQRALLLGASAVIVCHCHPSGDPSPSEADKQTTGELKAVMQILGIGFLDHIIVAGANPGKFFSFSGAGML